MDIEPNENAWISDGTGNHVKLNAITAITVEKDTMHYRTYAHFGTGSIYVHSEWAHEPDSRYKCKKVADGLFKLIQGE